MIGFFDSGVGGLTILEAVHRLMPEYDTLYLGDTAHAPYGNKTHEELVELTWAGAEWLFSQGCELIIIACNTASASALREIQQQRLPAYPGKRILGIIRPTVEELAKRGHRDIVVLSTEATKQSGAYVMELEKLNPDIRVHSHACPRWAPMIEAGLADTSEMRAEVAKEIRAFEADFPNYDAVLLACTHYPYVSNQVEKALSKPVPVYNQGDLVAKSLRHYLDRHPEMDIRLAKQATRRYFTSGEPAKATNIATAHFGFSVIFRHMSQA